MLEKLRMRLRSIEMSLNFPVPSYECPAAVSLSAGWYLPQKGESLPAPEFRKYVRLRDCSLQNHPTSRERIRRQCPRLSPLIAQGPRQEDALDVRPCKEAKRC